MIGAGLLARDVVAGVPTGAIEARAVSGRLVVCPTPIGNLEDVTLRVLAALREADVVACEDTRHTRVAARALRRRRHARLLPRAQRARPRGRAGRADARRARSSRWCRDAGMPLVSDPGYVLVQGCVAAGLAVEVLPGPSAALDRAGGVARCRPTPGASPASCRASAPRWRRSSRAPETVVAFESPSRVGASLAVLAELDPDRPVAVCRELTKLHEEVVRGSGGGARGPLRRRAAARRDRVGRRRRPRAHGRRPRARRGRPQAGRAGARPRVAAGVVAELTGLRDASDVCQRWLQVVAPVVGGGAIGGITAEAGPRLADVVALDANEAHVATDE